MNQIVKCLYFLPIFSILTGQIIIILQHILNPWRRHGPIDDNVCSYNQVSFFYREFHLDQSKNFVYSATHIYFLIPLLYYVSDMITSGRIGNKRCLVFLLMFFGWVCSFYDVQLFPCLTGFYGVEACIFLLVMYLSDDVVLFVFLYAIGFFTFVIVGSIGPVVNDKVLLSKDYLNQSTQGDIEKFLISCVRENWNLMLKTVSFMTLPLCVLCVLCKNYDTMSFMFIGFMALYYSSVICSPCHIDNIMDKWVSGSNPCNCTLYS